MKFDVAKFLALTAVLASSGGVAAGCSDTDGGETDSQAGSSSSAGESNKGGSSTGGSSTQVGGADGQAGESVAGANGANGGAQAGGAGGAATNGGEASGGAGGAGIQCLLHDPSVESPCADAGPQTDCATEDVNAFLGHCSNLLFVPSVEVQNGIIADFLQCGLDATIDPCSTVDAAACWRAARGKGCTTDEVTTACESIATLCDTAGARVCGPRLAQVAPASHPTVVDCMDPAGENYDAAFLGNCTERLDACLGIPAPAAL